MRLRFRARRRATAGVSLVEFALMAPFAFVLLLGALDYARAGYDQSVTHNAAREGVRAVIPSNQLGDSMSQLHSVIINAVSKTLGGGITVSNSVTDASSYSSCPTNPSVGQAIVCFVTPNVAPPSNHQVIGVQVSYSFQPWVPIVANLLNGIVFTSNVSMTTEY